MPWVTNLTGKSIPENAAIFYEESEYKPCQTLCVYKINEGEKKAWAKFFSDKEIAEYRDNLDQRD